MEKWLKLKDGNGFMFSILLESNTIAEITRLWKVLMKQNKVPYFNIIASRLKEQFPKDVEADFDCIKRQCKGCRISSIEKTGKDEYTLQLKRREKKC